MIISPQKNGIFSGMYGKDDKVLVINYNSVQRKNPALKMYVLSQYCTNFCENAHLKTIVEVNKIKAYSVT